MIVRKLLSRVFRLSPTKQHKRDELMPEAILRVRCAVTPLAARDTLQIKQIVMTSALWDALYCHLMRSAPPDGTDPDEQLAFILASVKRTPLGDSLLARELIPAMPADFVQQSKNRLEPKSQFVAAAIKRCRKEGWSLIEAHSHPLDQGGATTFSDIDWGNDREKMPAIASILDTPFVHATMVIGPNALDAHFYERKSMEILPIERVILVGETLRYLPTTASSRREHPVIDGERYQRHEMIFGRETQEKLDDTTVAIVGLGGLGSFVALELAHLGVGHLVLIDPDRVEVTNPNRLLGATLSDIGELKVDVYARLVRGISAHTQVTKLPLSLLDRYDSAALAYAKGADVLFGCVDSDGARLILNQIAIRYLIPLVDGGTGAHYAGEEPQGVTMAGGQAQIVLPGFGCLECRGTINAQRACMDLASEEVQEEIRTHNYGTREVAPSVIFLNGVIASLQVAELLFLLTDARLEQRSRPPLSFYDALSRKVRPVSAHYNVHCPACGSDGLTGVGDLVPIEFASSYLTGEPIPDASRE